MSVSLSALPGAWRRSLLEWPGGRDTQTTVLWVQGPVLYADLRLGAGGTEGFAGSLTCADGVFEWHRRMDLSPPGPLPDRATLAWSGDVLVETGTEAPYTEHWHRLPGSEGPSGAVSYLRGGVPAILVRAGGYAGFACGAEISVGRVEADGWRVGWSSVPGLVGERRELVPAGRDVVIEEMEGEMG